MRLMSRHLKLLGACSVSVKDFRKLFPKGAPLTKTSVRKARKGGLKLVWLCVRVRGFIYENSFKNLCPKGSCRFCDDTRKNLGGKSTQSLLKLCKEVVKLIPIRRRGAGKRLSLQSL